ncbi:tyrosine-protein phosphatase [Ferrimonas senticii]|uniref:phosphatase domain-containing putative toxin n=1 Tax=Ferrimonas senticii TaxID=394566 RepID=UPI0004299010|nr:tyrosine-protein phosphatase [Ferrimonas senticii]
MSFTPALTAIGELQFALHPAPGLDGQLTADVATLKQAGVGVVVTTLTPAELTEFGLAELGQTVQAADIVWLHLPVQDKSLPAAEFEQGWADALEQLTESAAAGERISVHCRGGTGRTGLVAAKIALALGADFDATIDAIRVARPGALQAEAQLDYLRG